VSQFGRLTTALSCGIMETASVSRFLKVAA
jgi:hypothetical protein